MKKSSINRSKKSAPSVVRLSDLDASVTVVQRLDGTKKTAWTGVPNMSNERVVSSDGSIMPRPCDLKIGEGIIRHDRPRQDYRSSQQENGIIDREWDARERNTKRSTNTISALSLSAAAAAAARAATKTPAGSQLDTQSTDMHTISSRTDMYQKKMGGQVYETSNSLEDSWRGKTNNTKNSDSNSRWSTEPRRKPIYENNEQLSIQNEKLKLVQSELQKEQALTSTLRNEIMMLTNANQQLNGRLEVKEAEVNMLKAEVQATRGEGNFFRSR